MDSYTTKKAKKIMLIYESEGRKELEAGNVDLACFLITQAYIFALEAGASKSKTLYSFLKYYGRED